MQLGPHTVEVPVMLAPMAGMSDLPYREIARELGAGYAVGEMTSSRADLRGTRKSVTRWVEQDESGLKVVQLVGAIPEHFAQAAGQAEASGADIIDINMGCPARKVLATACGSALMKDEALVERILKTVVAAVHIPVTLKMRTGWSEAHKNAPLIARIAEESGIAMLTVHGRTREAGFSGEAEYDTIAQVKAAVNIPVIANGDITDAQKACAVMAQTGADGVMIGRASYGNPWIFGQVAHALGFDVAAQQPSLQERRRVVLKHMQLHYDYYGSQHAALTMRKHLVHYLKEIEGAENVLEQVCAATEPAQQMQAVVRFFDELAVRG